MDRTVAISPAQNLLDRAANRPLRVIGLMSGTSVDGVDVALIETDGRTVARFGPSGSWPYEPTHSAAIRQVFGRDVPDAATNQADALVNGAHARAVESFLTQHGLERRDIDLIGFHGQTITHRPSRRFTWQIGDGSRLARRLGLPVVDGMRLADVAAGGQGAPLVPAYHAALAVGLDCPLAMLNIGGIANVTWVGSDGSLLAFDTGPGNGPLDRWVHQHSPFEYDRDGEVSAAGKPIEAAVEALLSATYFRQRPPKSLDAGDLRITLPDTASLEDGAATLARCVAASVACAVGHLPAPPRQWLVCGGGAHNRTIMRFLQEALGVPVRPASDLGWDGDALEAQAFAFLAVRSLRGLPLTYPTTTGCPQPISGGVLHWPD